MSGPPSRSGFVQLAVRLVVEPSTAASVGFAGLADRSLTSATVTVIACVAVFSRVPVPLVACTVTW